MIENVFWFSCKAPFILVRFNETCIFSTVIRKKYSNTEFHENPSSESRVVPCGQKGGRTDMTKRTVAFRNFAKAPKNYSFLAMSVLEGHIIPQAIYSNLIFTLAGHHRLYLE
jgi:hypothetical protein